MKKIVYSLAVLFSVALVSCGGEKKAEAVDTDTMLQVEEVVAVDSANDTLVAAEAYVVAAGDTVAQAAEVAEVPAAN